MPKYVYEAPTFEIPERRFYLFRNPIQTVEQSFYTRAEPDTVESIFISLSDEEAMLPAAELQEKLHESLDILNSIPPRYQSANLWWSDDRA